jgi:hypothetical protein
MAQPSGNAQLYAQAWRKLTNEGKPEDNIFEEYSLLKRLESGKRFRSFTGGASLLGTIEYAVNSTVESISPTSVLNTDIVDVFDEWEANWKQYAGTMTMTSFEESTNRGESAKFNLEKGKMKNLRASMRKTINEHIAGATSTATDLSGLQSLVPDSPSSGSIQGINFGTYTFWRSKQTSGAQSVSAHDNLRASMRSIRVSCSKGQGVKFPTEYVTGSGTANAYEGLLIANERVSEKSNKYANAGFQGDVYKFGTADVFWDGDIADSRMYAINDDNLQMAYQSGFWFKGYPSVNPANQLIDVFKVETQCQLFSNNRRHLGVITSIS